MSGSDFFWIAVGFVLAGIVGGIAGGYTAVATLIRSHNESLPRKRKG